MVYLWKFDVGIRGWLLLPALGSIVGLFAPGYLVLSWVPFIDADIRYNVPALVKEAHRTWAHAAVLAVVALGTVTGRLAQRAMVP